MEAECNELFPNEGNTLLVFGNGLDVDLGFPTTYKDYFLSNFFPFNDHSCHALGHYVYEKGVREKWYDLENILAEYGSKVGDRNEKEVQGDKEDYQNIVQGLSNYLKSLDYRQPKIDSVAANVLRAANDHLVPPTIYTFNYTDLETISAALGTGYTNIHHVHGCLKNNDIVLGVGEYVKLGSSALIFTRHPVWGIILVVFSMPSTLMILLSYLDCPCHK